MNNESTCYITCAGRKDGVGAQIHGILSTMLYCNNMGYNYLHTPLQQIAHAPIAEKNWEKDWENFFSLGENEIQINDLSHLNLNFIQIEDPTKLPTEKIANTVFVVPHCHFYTDTVPDDYKKMEAVLVEKYNQHSKKKYKSFHHPHKINIAVHIRRGDVSLDKYPNRFTENEWIFQLLTNIQNALSIIETEIVIHVFSQGELADFKALSGSNIHFHLNECLFTTFNSMVNADILVMGKSSFSYIAALFSNGIKLYEPFWHQPQKDWLVINKTAGFDATDFSNKVIDLLFEKRVLKTQPI